MGDPFEFHKMRIEELEAENARLREALTPSADTKRAYMGEFTIERDTVDDDGNPGVDRIPVPWTTVKQIMVAIFSRAAAPRDRTEAVDV
jgi:hypothetical protein